MLTSSCTPFSPFGDCKNLAPSSPQPSGQRIHVLPRRERERERGRERERRRCTRRLQGRRRPPIGMTGPTRRPNAEFQGGRARNPHGWDLGGGQIPRVCSNPSFHSSTIISIISIISFFFSTTLSHPGHPPVTPRLGTEGGPPVLPHRVATTGLPALGGRGGLALELTKRGIR